MLYPKEDRALNKLMYSCRTCQFSEPAASACVYRHDLSNTVGETAGVTQDVAADPTVGSPDDLCLLCGQEIQCGICGQGVGGLRWSDDGECHDDFDDDFGDDFDDDNFDDHHDDNMAEDVYAIGDTSVNSIESGESGESLVPSVVGSVVGSEDRETRD